MTYTFNSVFKKQSFEKFTSDCYCGQSRSEQNNCDRSNKRAGVGLHILFAITCF